MMEKTKRNIYGASGHARVIIDILHSQGLEIFRIFDDNQDIEYFAGNRVYHCPNEITEMDIPTVICIGDNQARKKVASNFQGVFSSCISHSSAVVSPSSQAGLGTVIMANASVNSRVEIGRHCVINTGATVEHECILEDYVHISPNAALAGNVHVGEGTHIGIGAVIIPGIKIGKWVTIGAGAVIIEDIPDNVVVVGNPGRVIKYKDYFK